MKQIIIGIGELASSTQEDAILKTYALGSCVAVIMLDPVERAVGMVHIALPDSEINPSLARAKPGMFADTGIAVLLQRMLKCGSQSPNIIVKLCGGANVLNQQIIYQVGKKNILAARNVIQRNLLRLVAEDVGGNISRTVKVEVKSGLVVISCPGRKDWQL